MESTIDKPLAALSGGNPTTMLAIQPAMLSGAAQTANASKRTANKAASRIVDDECMPDLLERIDDKPCLPDRTGNASVDNKARPENL
jgi:CDP-diacylglycerol pyrophosphatase